LERTPGSWNLFGERGDENIVIKHEHLWKERLKICIRVGQIREIRKSL